MYQQDIFSFSFQISFLKLLKDADIISKSETKTEAELDRKSASSIRKYPISILSLTFINLYEILALVFLTL